MAATREEKLLPPERRNRWREIPNRIPENSWLGFCKQTAGVVKEGRQRATGMAHRMWWKRQPATAKKLRLPRENEGNSHQIERATNRGSIAAFGDNVGSVRLGPDCNQQAGIEGHQAGDRQSAERFAGR